MLNLSHIERLKNQLNQQTLVAVTKYASDEDMYALLKEDIHHFGENRVNVFLNKLRRFKDEDITWHFIGHLQSKKVKKMINDIDYLHSLDRMSLANEIEKRREDVLPAFIEVNISGEASKYGLAPEKVIDFYKNIQSYDKINVIGLMGMATHTDNEAMIRKQFQILIDLKEKMNDVFALSLKLSMGMSNDFEIAMDMGSSYVRIGSYLFEEED